MKNKLLKLIEKEGFILFLFVCVCVVAGGTLFISMKNMKESNKISNNISNNVGNEDFIIIDEDTAKEDSIYDEKLHMIKEANAKIIATNTDDDLEEIVEVITDEEDYAEIETEELEFEEDEQEEDVEDSDLVQEVKTIFLPVDGPIITEYTSNSLIYSETLESWVGHGAIDIEASEGTIVKAAADGVVKEVYEDELWGIVIVIDHGGELQTRYSCLGTKEMVKVGLNVKKGDHISKVGNTAKIEMLMKPHLHFEVIKNGKLVEPRSINN